MKAEIETTGAAISQFTRLNASPAPSLRVPVTAGNRALLRWMRAAESFAWDAPTAHQAGGCACGGGCFPANPAALQNHSI